MNNFTTQGLGVPWEQCRKACGAAREGDRSVPGGAAREGSKNGPKYDSGRAAPEDDGNLPGKRSSGGFNGGASPGGAAPPESSDPDSSATGGATKEDGGDDPGETTQKDGSAQTDPAGPQESL